MNIRCGAASVKNVTGFFRFCKCSLSQERAQGQKRAVYGILLKIWDDDLCAMSPVLTSEIEV